MIPRHPLCGVILAVVVLAPPAAAAQGARRTTAATSPPAPASAAARPVEVQTWVDRTAIWVGDRVTYGVDIVCARGVEVLLDDLAREKLRVNGLDVVSSDTTTTVDASERTTYRLRYVLTSYRVDMPSLSIEPLSARYYARRPGQRLQDIAPAGEIAIRGATVAFRSTLPDQRGHDLRDGRAAVARHPVMARAKSIGLAFVVVALAPAVFVAIALVRRRPRTAGRRSARQARIDHQTTIERLRSQDVTTEEDRRQAYDQISAAVRQHLVSRSGLPATGLTAAELDAAMATVGGGVPRESATSLLRACDLARYGPPHALPSAQDCRDALSAAQQLLAAR